jgi:hypothetical protein
MVAGPRFLTAMQIPIPAGRDIDDPDERGSTPGAVISERLARTYFKNENRAAGASRSWTRSAIS